MSNSRHTTLFCGIIAALTLAFTLLLSFAKAAGAIGAITRTLGYEAKIFDTSYVHSIDIVMDADDWQSFLDTAENEEYAICSVTIDGETVKNCAIRAKGNTSLSNVKQYGNDRYSFKIEFDHYDDTLTYHGLDKLVLNNNIQDNTLMKDYLTYRMMAYMGVDAPLVSYAFITVNGEDFGLYLALEAVEESFLERNYGADYGELYKPDSISMGGGRGNGRDFDMQDFADENGLDFDFDKSRPSGNDSNFTPPDKLNGDNSGNGGFTPPDAGNMPDMNGKPNMGDMPGGFGGMGSGDVSLIYSDDEFDSYSNIFNSAKTAITSKDKTRLIASLKKLNANEDIEDVVDVEQVIRYFVVHNFVDNFDSYTGSMIHNYYLYEKDGKLSMIPWDYNLAFGGFMSGDATEMVNYPIDTPVSGGSMDSRPMLNWIFQSEEYTALYHSIMQEFMDSFFASGKFETLIDETYELIAPYAERDTNSFCTYAEFEQGVSTLRQFCLLRAESIQGQLDGTIPSTADGQSADSSALIDAFSITLSDMGSFGGGKAGFRPQ